MNYQTKDIEARQLLDRPRWQEWYDYEVEHILRQAGQDKGIFAEPEECRVFPVRKYLEEIQSGGHEIDRLLHHMSKLIDPSYHRYLHYGLTSSNVIDTCNHRRWIKLLKALHARIEEWRHHYFIDETKIVGMTHGRKAHRLPLCQRFYTAIATKLLVFTFPEDVTKTSTDGGPTGNYYHRQAVGRDSYWPIWTNLAQIAFACEQLATDYRFYCSDFSDVVGIKGTLALGVATTSSAMPGKVNPTVFERVCSVGFMVRNLCTTQMLLPPKWLDADLVHSAMERETIDRMWDHTFWLVETMRELMNTTTLEVTYSPKAYTSHDALKQEQANGELNYSDARDYASKFPTG